MTPVTPTNFEPGASPQTSITTRRTRKKASTMLKVAAAAAFTVSAVFAGLGAGGQGTANASSHFEGECYFSGSLVYCTYTSEHGIKHVLKTGTLIDQQVTMWDETYDHCPTEVTIGGWGDHISALAPMSLHVETCDGSKGGLGIRGGGGGGDDRGGFAIAGRDDDGGGFAAAERGQDHRDGAAGRGSSREDEPAPRDTQLPDSDTQRASRYLQLPDSDTQLPDSDTQRASRYLQLPDSDSQLPDSDTQLPDSDTQLAETSDLLARHIDVLVELGIVEPEPDQRYDFLKFLGVPLSPVLFISDSGQPAIVVLSHPASFDLTVGEDDAAKKKPKVGVWGKCQVPGKCEIGFKIIVKF